MAAAVDPVSLGKRYQQQLTQTIGTLQERAMVIKQSAQSTVNEGKAMFEGQREQMQPVLDGYKASLQDLQSPVPANSGTFLLKSYLWTGVCLFAFTVARIVSGLFLYGIVGMVFDTWVATLLTYVVFPAFVFMNLRKVQMSEVEREQVVLLASVIEGALVGALFSSRYPTISGPPIFLLPVAVGLLAHYVGNNEKVTGNRQVFLSALVGGAVLAYVVFGFVFNFNFTYIVSVVILGGAAVADLQLKVASFQRGDSSPQLEQWKTIVIMTIAGAVSRYWASTGKERAAEIKQEPILAKVK